MNHGTMLVWIVGGIAGVILSALLFVKLPGDVPAATDAAIILVQSAGFTRKPCPDCEASSIRIAPSDHMNRCQVCGCEFISAD